LVEHLHLLLMVELQLIKRLIFLEDQSFNPMYGIIKRFREETSRLL
jgi:hypothetical protein